MRIEYVLDVRSRERTASELAALMRAERDGRITHDEKETAEAVILSIEEALPEKTDRGYAPEGEYRSVRLSFDQGGICDMRVLGESGSCGQATIGTKYGTTKTAVLVGKALASAQ